MVQKNSVVDTVLNITGEVGDSSVVASFVKMEVEPSDQLVFGGKVSEVFEFFVFLQESSKIGVVLQGNLGKEGKLKWKTVCLDCLVVGIINLYLFWEV